MVGRLIARQSTIVESSRNAWINWAEIRGFQRFGRGLGLLSEKRPTPIEFIDGSLGREVLHTRFVLDFNQTRIRCASGYADEFAIRVKMIVLLALERAATCVESFRPRPGVIAQNGEGHGCPNSQSHLCTSRSFWRSASQFLPSW